ncbi:aspartate 1-decarboxylase [candidate division WOR-3 bacterium]|nr:aspartate 1-decarboxylase [candidate division WOR-3 bacterium]
MLRRFVKVKLHGLKVTEANLAYTGSIGIDSEILKKASLMPGEMVLVANLNNGERFQTYIIEEEPFSGEVKLNGAAARLGLPNDRLIIMSEVLLSMEEIDSFEMTVLKFDGDNRLIN